MFGIPGCEVEEGNLCDRLREALFALAYNDVPQQHLVPAEVSRT